MGPPFRKTKDHRPEACATGCLKLMMGRGVHLYLPRLIFPDVFPDIADDVARLGAGAKNGGDTDFF